MGVVLEGLVRMLTVYGTDSLRSWERMEPEV